MSGGVNILHIGGPQRAQIAESPTLDLFHRALLFSHTPKTEPDCFVLRYPFYFIAEHILKRSKITFSLPVDVPESVTVLSYRYFSLQRISRELKPYQIM